MRRRITGFLTEPPPFFPDLPFRDCLQYVTGFDSRSAGLFLLIPQAFPIVLGPSSGRLPDRYPPYRVAAAGGLVNAAAMLLLVSLGESTPSSWSSPHPP
jgi:predicted MFS family arabinose efflux permease